MSVTFTPTGVRVDYDDDAGSWMNLHNANARALLAALGLATPAHHCDATASLESMAARSELNELLGSCTLPEARRALLRARNTDLSALERPGELVYGAPRQAEDGSIELRPLRCVSGGLDLEGLRRRLDDFERLVARAAALGAPGISWG
jgi:hypothetical protein